MKFGFGYRLGLAVLVLLWGNLAAVAIDGKEKDMETITIVVNAIAHVTPSILDQAESETTRIFRRSGIQIVWLNCRVGIAAEESCRRVLEANDFVLQIVPNGRTPTESVFGEAFLGRDGKGKYCDVFFDRVEEAHSRFGAGTSRLLGAVAAHELGHLLLGLHAHSHAGIMTSHWKAENLQQIEMGTFLFSSEQSSRMKARISGSEGEVARGAMRGGE